MLLSSVEISNSLHPWCLGCSVSQCSSVCAFLIIAKYLMLCGLGAHAIVTLGWPVALCYVTSSPRAVNPLGALVQGDCSMYSAGYTTLQPPSRVPLMFRHAPSCFNYCSILPLSLCLDEALLTYFALSA